VFENILLNDQLIWLVILTFYLFDNIKQLSSFQMVLRERWNLRWRADLPSPTFVILHRRFQLINPLMPYGLAIRLTWLTETPNDPSKIRRADRFLRVMKRKVVGLRYLSAISFVLFFIVGPFLTYEGGLTFALQHVAPAYLATLAGVVFTLFSDRKFWRLTAGQIVSLALECAVCPGYLVNITRKMSWNFTALSVDGGIYGLHRTTSNSAMKLKQAMIFAIEELEQEVGEDANERERLTVYAKIVSL
jgi:hypothetical protein